MPEPKKLRVLLAVTDDKASSTLRAYLRARGDVAESVSAGGLPQAIRASRPRLMCLSVEAGSHNLAALRRSFPELTIVAVAPPISSIAFEAARQGAAELLTLPLNQESMAAELGPILDRLAGEPADDELRGEAPAGSLPRLLSSSPRMAAIRDTIEKVASTTATVLIRGESGVGKEVVARMIFERSGRNQRPFVKVNCAAIPDDLLESELFGYEAGAFTGAQRSKPGKFELADGGTLFLDEIGEMHPALQAKLLHVLQDGEFARLGSRRDTA